MIVTHIAHRAGVSVILITILLVMRATACSAERCDTCKSNTLIAIRTNTLYDALLIPNIGAELQMKNGWAIQLDWLYTWFSSDNRHRYWQAYGGYLTVKKYFEFLDWVSDVPLVGHHIGFYLTGLTYDLEWGGKGYEASKFGFGGGVEYGYSWRIGRSMKMDFSIGLGFQDGEYKEYEPSNDKYNHYVWLATKKRHWWGPTKLELTLAWFLGGKKKTKSIGNIDNINKVYDINVTDTINAIDTINTIGVTDTIKTIHPIETNRKGGGL